MKEEKEKKIFDSVCMEEKRVVWMEGYAWGLNYWDSQWYWAGIVLGRYSIGQNWSVVLYFDGKIDVQKP